MKISIKKTAALIIGAGIIAVSTSVFAAEAWRDAFVSRIVNSWSTDPTCTDVVMTDIDKNGIPEAFLVKPGTLGEITTGFTMSNNAIVQIGVPHNISGDCLKDITVYSFGNDCIYIGREIARYSNVIAYYQLKFDGHTLSAERVNKSKFGSLAPIKYKDVYSGDFFSNGYPNRAKLQKFIYDYENLSQLTATLSDATVRVNGTDVNLPGYMVDNNNYYKIRDIAMILRNTSKRFDVAWDNNQGKLNILTKTPYTIVGGELTKSTGTNNLEIVMNTGSVLKDGQSTTVPSYNINGNNYFKIRDIANLVGFTVGWDEATSTITITA